MIIVLKGGDSAEREVSLLTAKSIVNSLNRLGVKYLEIDASDRHWLEHVKAAEPKLVIIALHGTFGEDGAVQTILEQNNIPFTGSGSKASKTAFNKIETKDLVANKLNIDVPKTYRSNEVPKFPVVIKPNQQGSSFGVSIANNDLGLTSALVSAKKYCEKNSIIIEEYIKGVELTCAVTDVFGVLKPLPSVEIIPKSSFFDYYSKYESDSGCLEICPARIPKVLANEIAEKSMQVHRLLKLRQYSRSDWIYRDGRLFFLEVNTLPGMTPTSLLPKELKAAGIDYDEFIEALVFARK